MSLIYAVTISDQVEVADSVTRTPNRLDVLIQDIIAISDLVVMPRGLAVASVEPGRVRAGDSVTINGQGFATSTASNRVTFNGFVAAVTAASENQLTVTVPALIAFTENGYAEVIVESPPGSALKGRFRVWAKWSTAEEEADELLPLQLAQRNEDADDRPRFAEAEDFNKLQSLIEYSQTGGAEEQGGGGFKSRGTIGIAGAPKLNPPNLELAGGGGESLVIDPSQPGLLALSWRMDDVLAFGGLFQSANTGFFFLIANAETEDSVSAGVEIEQVAMLDGVVDLVWFLVKAGGGDVITDTELHVGGVSVFSDPSNFGNNSVASLRPGVSVSKGDRIRLRLSKSGAAAQLRIVGGVRVRYS